MIISFSAWHMYMWFYLDATLTFSQSSYSVNESNGTLSVVLVLSNASLFDIVIQVDSIDDTAAGKLFLINQLASYPNTWLYDARSHT